MATFSNRAILSYNGVTTASNTVTGELIGALTLEKTALAGSYAAGDSITYTISLVNSGSTALEGLTLTDDLGSFSSGGAELQPLTYVDGTAALFINGLPQAAPSVNADDGLVFTGVSVPAGGNALIIYETEVNSYAPLSAGSVIENTVTASGAQLQNPVGASESVAVSSEPQLSVIKSMYPLTVLENGTLTYTFVIENAGNAPAAAGDALSLGDTFSPILSELSVSLDGSPLASPADYAYNSVTGEFSTVPGVITVPAAVFTRASDGSLGVTPGRTTLTVSGRV